MNYFFFYNDIHAKGMVMELFFAFFWQKKRECTARPASWRDLPKKLKPLGDKETTPSNSNTSPFQIFD